MDDHAPNTHQRLYITRRVFISAATIVLLIGFGVYATNRIDRLKRDAHKVTNGMDREQVERILGEPYMSLPVSGEAGQMLVWIDNFWQIDVRVDNNDRVVMRRCLPANSAFRRTQSWISSLAE